MSAGVILFIIMVLLIFLSERGAKGLLVLIGLVALIAAIKKSNTFILRETRWVKNKSFVLLIITLLNFFLVLAFITISPLFVSEYYYFHLSYIIDLFQYKDTAVMMTIIVGGFLVAITYFSYSAAITWIRQNKSKWESKKHIIKCVFIGCIIFCFAVPLFEFYNFRCNNKNNRESTEIKNSNETKNDYEYLNEDTEGINLRYNIDLDGDHSEELILGRYIDSKTAEIAIYTYDKNESMYCGSVNIDYFYGEEAWISKQGEMNYFVTFTSTDYSNKVTIYEVEDGQLKVHKILLQTWNEDFTQENYYIDGEEILEKEFIKQNTLWCYDQEKTELYRAGFGRCGS